MISLFLIIFALFPSAEAAEMRLALHGTHSLTEQVGLASWVIEPNVLDDQRQAFAITGLRLPHQKWWLEVMGGAMLQDQDPWPVLDLRASWTATSWLSFWAELAWTQGPYYFVEVDFPLPKIGALGLEVESGGHFGPHLILPFGDHLTLIAAVRTDTTRAYVVFDF